VKDLAKVLLNYEVIRKDPFIWRHKSCGDEVVAFDKHYPYDAIILHENECKHAYKPRRRPGR